MGAGRYDVVVRMPGSDQAEVRRWTAAEVETALPWLKRWNAQGREILVRPAPGEDAELVRVGGLSAAAVATMSAAGREPAVVVETSPGQLEVWVRVPGCDAARRSEIARQLAVEYGAAPKGASPDGYGRLTGFTTEVMTETAREGRTWVLCRASSGRMARAGAALVDEAGQRLDDRAQELARERQRAQRFQALTRPRDQGVER